MYQKQRFDVIQPMRPFLLLFLFLFCGTANAQNLVINPGFEEHNKKGRFDLYNGFQSLGVKGWYQPAGGTSDFFWVAPGRVGEETFLGNYIGKTAPNSGNCFAGFYAGMSYFEYVGGTLSRKLEKGQTYKVAIALQLGSKLKGHSDAIDVYFSREKTKSNGSYRLKFVPQVSLTGTGDKSISGNWKIFTAEFTAEGDEQFFIIGNITGKNTSGKSGGYYLIDDIYVAPAGNDTAGFPVAAVKPLEPGQPITVKVPSPSMDNKPINTDTIAAGKTLVCNNVCFESDQSAITAESYPQLYLILSELKKQPG